MSNQNEPAYPTQEVRDINGNGIIEGCYGLTKRELFAAMAMQSLFSQPSLHLNHKDVVKNVCESSVKIADALLEALK